MDAKPRELYLLFRAYEVSLMSLMHVDYLHIIRYYFNHKVRNIFKFNYVNGLKVRCPCSPITYVISRVSHIIYFLFGPCQITP